MSVAAVIITYNPDEKFPERLAAIVRECKKVFVVDNGSKNLAGLRKVTRRPGVTLIALGTNTGIAHAQNAGVAAAFATRCDGVILFDHDSVPRPGYLEAIRAAAGTTRIAGPRVYDTNKHSYALYPTRGRLFFRRREVVGEAILENLLMVIASGCFIPRTVWQKVGTMREDYFIDYVDWEYCLRAWHKFGIPTVVTGAAVLEHARGERAARKFGPLTVHPPGYSAFRYAHIFRNRARLLRSYLGKDRAFAAFEMVALARDLVLLLTERRPFALLYLALRSWVAGFVRG